MKLSQNQSVTSRALLASRLCRIFFYYFGHLFTSYCVALLISSRNETRRSMEAPNVARRLGRARESLHKKESVSVQKNEKGTNGIRRRRHTTLAFVSFRNSHALSFLFLYYEKLFSFITCAETYANLTRILLFIYLSRSPLGSSSRDQ